MISIAEEIKKLDRTEVLRLDAEKRRRIEGESYGYYSCQDGGCGSCDYCIGAPR